MWFEMPMMNATKVRLQDCGKESSLGRMGEYHHLEYTLEYIQ
jgi:hypothetical protein